MKVSCLQLNPQADLSQNLNTAYKMVEDAAQGGADVVVLPEMFAYRGDEKKQKEISHRLETGVFKELQELAKKLEVILVGGSHYELSEKTDKAFNTCVTFCAQGQTLSVYRKLHLFNLRDEFFNPLYMESESILPGVPPQGYEITANNEKWDALNIICYDLRFPEIIRAKSVLNDKNKAWDILFVPAAFTWQTGKDHWEVLLRARAIENQCYVVACNQTGSFSENKKRNFGNSMVVDPWGNIIARLGEEVGILSAQVLKSEIDSVRLRLPALEDRVMF